MSRGAIAKAQEALPAIFAALKVGHAAAIDAEELGIDKYALDVIIAELRSIGWVCRTRVFSLGAEVKMPRGVKP